MAGEVWCGAVVAGDQPAVETHRVGTRRRTRRGMERDGVRKPTGDRALAWPSILYSLRPPRWTSTTTSTLASVLFMARTRAQRGRTKRLPGSYVRNSPELMLIHT
jgi:hypothetical protein